ncbi:MAG: hypothetical protein J6R92_07220 [Akkermansia sp.]|nr:hypothetical protein [Akkermansia sp.]
MSKDTDGHISIDFRQPVGTFMKCLMVLLSAFLLAFLVGALLGECEEPVWKWLIVTMAVVPAIGSTGATIFVLWGRKYLLLKEDSVEIHWKLWGWQWIKLVQLGRRSRLLLRKKLEASPDSDGDTRISEVLELLLTDAHGQMHRLLQFDMKQRARVEEIAAEIVQHLPQLPLELE